MSKSAIITCTAGDFEYMDEWIQYHHNLGVDLFLIGYNGPSEKFRNYKQYDYVRYMDFSYNDTNLKEFKESAFSSIFTSDVYGQGRMQKIENILFYYLKVMYRDIKYCAVIDTDEFISIKDERYNNINKYLDDNFPDGISTVSMIMDFYTDNNLVYKDSRPCMERFTELSKNPFPQKNKHFFRKVIIDMHNERIKGIVLTSPHESSDNESDYDLPKNQISLNHYWSKSLEEWIEKMSPDIDPDYFRRFRGNIFYCYFYDACDNKVTEEKIKAIPGLLEKYNIKYEINKEERDSEFKKLYCKYHNLTYYTKVNHKHLNINKLKKI